MAGRILVFCILANSITMRVERGILFLAQLDFLGRIIPRHEILKSASDTTGTAVLWSTVGRLRSSSKKSSPTAQSRIGIARVHDSKGPVSKFRIDLNRANQLSWMGRSYGKRMHANGYGVNRNFVLEILSIVQAGATDTDVNKA